MYKYLFLLGLVGCTTNWSPVEDGHYKVWVEGDFNISQRANIQHAMEDWNQATNNFVHIYFANNVDNANLIISSSTLSLLKSETKTKNPLGATWFLGEGYNLIEVAVENSEITFHEVIRHELGHALGLVHTEAGTIMCKKVECAAHNITCADVEQFCQVWGCSADLLEICDG